MTHARPRANEFLISIINLYLIVAPCALWLVMTIKMLFYNNMFQMYIYVVMFVF
jgi:hypothetical protein